MNIEPGPFSLLWAHPTPCGKPCEWRLLDHSRVSKHPSHDPLKQPALIGGTSRTYKEARGLLTRIARACQRAYRYGYTAGYRAGKAAAK